jgi:hypothetical protein
MSRLHLVLIFAALGTLVPGQAHAFGALNPVHWFHRSSSSNSAPPPVSAPSCTGSAETLTDLLYQAILFRHPDFPGANGWCGLVKTGFDGFAATAQGIVGSQEFQQVILPTHNRGEIIGQFYNVLYGRPIDSSGYATWVQGTQYSYSFVLNQVITYGSEFRNRYEQIMGGSNPPPQPPSSSNLLDLHQATLVHIAPDFADWPITTHITQITFTGNGLAIQMDNGRPDAWPDTPDYSSTGGMGSLLYTVGFVEKINGTWYASAPAWTWRGVPAVGGDIRLQTGVPGECTPSGGQIQNNLFYDTRWGPMTCYQPATGEEIGVFICAGNCRGGNPAESPVHERSDVVLFNLPAPGDSPVLNF